MISEATQYRLEANATAICLVFSAICFGIGAAMQHGSRAVTRAYGGTK